jgi:hypothetical protein
MKLQQVRRIRLVLGNQYESALGHPATPTDDASALHHCRRKSVTEP